MSRQSFQGFSVSVARTGVLLASDVNIPSSLLGRAKGLLGTSELKEDSGLLLRPCSMVHMFFMRYPIDVVFCSKDWEVVHLSPNLMPWRCSRYVPRAEIVLEFAAGKIEKSNLQVGDQLVFQNREQS